MYSSSFQLGAPRSDNFISQSSLSNNYSLPTLTPAKSNSFLSKSNVKFLPPIEKSSNNNLLVPLLLPSPCSFCTADALETVASSSFQIPIELEVPSSDRNFDLTKFQSGNPLLDENPIMDNVLFPQQYNYLPKRGVKRVVGDSEPNPFKHKVGMDAWYTKKRRERQEAACISRKKIQRTQKVLKRLQNHRFMRQWKMEKRIFFDEKESIRRSKFEMLRRKGLKAERREECPLWNCPKKEYQRKRPFRSLSPRDRSESRLSNLSRKSRSPIMFRRTL